MMILTSQSRTSKVSSVMCLQTISIDSKSGIAIVPANSLLPFVHMRSLRLRTLSEMCLVMDAMGSDNNPVVSSSSRSCGLSSRKRPTISERSWGGGTLLVTSIASLFRQGKFLLDTDLKNSTACDLFVILSVSSLEKSQTRANSSAVYLQ